MSYPDVYVFHMQNAERLESMARVSDGEDAQRLLARAGVQRKIAANIALAEAKP